MRRITWMTLVALVALAGASLAIAAHQDKGTTAATFAVSGTAGEVKTRTCTGVDGTYVHTHAVYNGTATGLYNGATARLKLMSTVNTTEGLGIAMGSLHLRSGDDLQAKAHLTGVVDGSTLSGVLVGRDVRGEDRGKLVANFSASLTTGAITLTVGSGSAENDGVLFGGTGCGTSLLSGALGTVSALTTTSITVATSGGAVTCGLTAEQAEKIDDHDIEVGDRVSIRCDAAGKLVKIERRR